MRRLGWLAAVQLSQPEASPGIPGRNL